MGFFTVLLAILAGFIILQLLTHSTKSKIRDKLPDIRTNRIQIFPVLRINNKSKTKTIHFHHWINFSILLAISVFATSSFLDSAITRGFLAGGVLQGLFAEPGRNLICNCHHCQKFKNSSSS